MGRNEQSQHLCAPAITAITFCAVNHLFLYSGYHYSHFPDRKVRGKEITKSAQEQIPRKQTTNLTCKHGFVCERCYMRALGSAIAGPGREGTGSFQSQSYVRLGNSPAQKTVLDLKIC